MNYNQLRSNPVAEEGEILIIAPEDFMETLQPYADWKTRNGFKVEMVTVDAAGNNANAIKTYISNYYNEHNLAFVLIVGDNAQFPTPTVSGNKSDNYFTEIAGNDSYPDIILGKLSAETVTQLETQVRRFIEYEQNPNIKFNTLIEAGLELRNSILGNGNNFNKKDLISMDDELPIFIYCSTQINTKNAPAEYHMIEDYIKYSSMNINESKVLTNSLGAILFISKQWDLNNLKKGKSSDDENDNIFNEDDIKHFKKNWNKKEYEFFDEKSEENIFLDDNKEEKK